MYSSDKSVLFVGMHILKRMEYVGRYLFNYFFYTFIIKGCTNSGKNEKKDLIDRYM